MYKRIVVPLGGSATAEGALPYAINLAEKYGGILSLVTAAHGQGELSNVVPSLMAQAAISQDVVARLESAREQTADRQYLDDLCKRFAENGIDVEVRVRVGRPAEQILKLTADLPDLVVLTAYGGGGAHTRSQRAVFGGVADKVLRESRIPVLVIRP